MEAILSPSTLKLLRFEIGKMPIAVFKNKFIVPFRYNFRHISFPTLDNYKTLAWRRGVVVSGVRRMNEVNAHRARLVPG